MSKSEQQIPLLLKSTKAESNIIGLESEWNETGKKIETRNKGDKKEAIQGMSILNHCRL